jgi:hypothetical protein
LDVSFAHHGTTQTVSMTRVAARSVMTVFKGFMEKRERAREGEVEMVCKESFISKK